MNRLLRPFLAGGLILATAIPFMSACADNHVTLFIRSVPKPTPPDCGVSTDPTAVQLLNGFVDVAFSSGYNLSLLVGNQMTPRGDKLNARAESTRISLDRAEVRLANSANEQYECADDENCGSFSVFGSGFIDTNASADPGYGIFNLTVLPPVLATELASTLAWGTQTTVVAGIRVSGETLGGEAVESGEFIYTIDVCNGCTVVYNKGACCDRTEEVPAEGGVSGECGVVTRVLCQASECNQPECSGPDGC